MKELRLFVHGPDGRWILRDRGKADQTAFSFRAERDGVIYQEVPQPGHPRGTTRSAEEYGYRSGVILPSSGHLRVRVTPTEAAVDYVKSDPTGTVAHRYSVSAQ